MNELLNQNDLGNIIRIIDTAAERGMFKGIELSTVGTLRDKVVVALETQNKPDQVEEMVIDTTPKK
jgi:hypothetical protein